MIADRKCANAAAAMIAKMPIGEVAELKTVTIKTADASGIATTMIASGTATEITTSAVGDVTEIVTMTIAECAIAAKVTAMMIVGAVKVQTIRQDICAAVAAPTTNLATCVVDVAGMTDPAMIAGGATATTIETTREAVSTKALPPTTPLAKVAGVDAVGAAGAAGISIPAAPELAGSRAAPVWRSWAGAALQLVQLES